MCDLPARRHAQESRPDHQGRSMSASYTFISPDKLSRLIGTAAAPALIDVSIDDSSADPRPAGSIARPVADARRRSRAVERPFPALRRVLPMVTRRDQGATQLADQ